MPYAEKQKGMIKAKYESNPSGFPMNIFPIYISLVQIVVLKAEFKYSGIILKTINMGIIVTFAGTIRVAKYKKKILFLPLNLNLEKAYAAIEQVISCPNVIVSDIKRLFTYPRAKGIAFHTRE